ncbi:peptidase C39 family protein [Aeromicrobium sp. CF4.19]|uniref:peptidase C39 family protein n=1 Tax=Aeromicrobium sp. CF4.19 TaxID=3373082 RepID=UPI003EE5C3E5
MRRLSVGAALVAVLSLLATGLTAAPASAVTDHSRTVRWDSPARLGAGSFHGVKVSGSSLVLSNPRSSKVHTDTFSGNRRVRYSYGHWTSPWTSAGTQANRLIPSWGASLPHGTFVRVLARVKRGSTVGSWDVVGEWSYGPNSTRRSSGPTQSDDLASVATDTVKANPNKRFSSWQLRIELLRKPGTTHTPKVSSVGASISSYATRSIGTSRTTMTRTQELRVPSMSQMTHRGHFPQWGGGGEAWCSPTSVAMILRYFKAGPPASKHAWAGTDGQVDHAARYSYDHRYKGTGNWSFSTAYAAQHGLDSFVARLSDLRDAEAFIKAGIPLVLSVRFGRGELSGAPISSTNGHLLVVRGFTADGRVIVNDPAGPSNTSVRRVYSRTQLERAWLKGSGGVTYVMRPKGKALPKDTWRW